MGIYVVVEGDSEKILYPNWIKYANPALTCVPSIEDVSENDVYIVSAGGYPGILGVIENAIYDVNDDPRFSKLVISVDSEDQTKKEKYDEIEYHVNSIGCIKSYEIIIQHFCIEAWALGNQKIATRNPADQSLKDYKKFYDVLINDPELLPPKEDEDLNRAQFAYKYLRLLFREKFPRASYKKNDPSLIAHQKYYERLVQRNTSTGHIGSFMDFCRAFN